ncbi:unnamed protein product, partial [Nesidiocoris tenuis]
MSQLTFYISDPKWLPNSSSSCSSVWWPQPSLAPSTGKRFWMLSTTTILNSNRWKSSMTTV